MAPKRGSSRLFCGFGADFCSCDGECVCILEHVDFSNVREVCGCLVYGSGVGNAVEVEGEEVGKKREKGNLVEIRTEFL